MNTLTKSNSIALAIALGFSMLATSTSLNAQSSERDYTGSERSINAADVKPVAKPTVSFSESVKTKVAVKNAAKQNNVEATSVAKTRTDEKVEAAIPAPAKAVVQPALKGQTGKKGQPVRSNFVNTNSFDSGTANDVVESKPAKVEEVKEVKIATQNNVAVVAPAKVAAPERKIIKPAVTPVAPVATVKYENASPGRAPKVETHPKPSAPIQIATIQDENITRDSKGSFIRETSTDSKK